MRNPLIAICLAGCLTAVPAAAVVTPFGGRVVGTDPLGHIWVATGTHWSEPGLLDGTRAFNPMALSNGAGNYATSFSFTLLKGAADTFDQTPSFAPFAASPETRFINLTDGVAWLVSFANGSVTFTAPNMAAKLDPGDHFFVNVNFAAFVDPTRFNFAGLWDDQAMAAAVPELASWAMMAAGFGLLGTVMRGRRRPDRLIT